MSKSTEFVTTKDRLLKATIDLMIMKGVKAVTTREIADRAGFSEMTLFRHFKSKQNLVEAAIDRFYHKIEITDILEKEVKYDLIEDLKLVSRTYHWYMEKNEEVVMLGFQERNTTPWIIQSMTKNPREFKAFLLNYFDKMEEMGKIKKIDKEVQAMNFMWLNLGYFLAKHIAGDRVAQIPLDVFIEESAKTFADGLEKEDK